MKERFRQFVNKLLPDTWQLIKWYNINEFKPDENAVVYCKGGLGVSHHYAAIYRDGVFTDVCFGGERTPAWWRYI